MVWRYYIIIYLSKAYTYTVLWVSSEKKTLYKYLLLLLLTSK